MSRFSFPKDARILRRSDFRKVYDHGFRFSCPFFAAFCFKQEAREVRAKVGFTVTKALGNAVLRNRMKRRLREAVRLNLAALPPDWMIVMNGRQALLDGEFSRIQQEVQRLFLRCANS